ncbi:MAG: hypothetical protein ABJL55_23080 [Roseibium sp.]
MSFRDSFGPFVPINGPDLLQDGRAARPDVDFQSSSASGAGGRSVIRSIANGAALFVGATVALTVLLFLPVFYGEVSSIEAVSVKGEMLTASEFVTKLKHMLFGTAIVALSLVSLIASAALASKRQSYRSVDDRSVSSQDKKTDPVLTALIGIRHV